MTSSSRTRARRLQSLLPSLGRSIGSERDQSIAEKHTCTRKLIIELCSHPKTLGHFKSSMPSTSTTCSGNISFLLSFSLLCAATPYVLPPLTHLSHTHTHIHTHTATTNSLCGDSSNSKQVYCQLTATIVNSIKKATQLDHRN